jgi:uncharacterized protein (TIGR02246 family)
MTSDETAIHELIATWMRASAAGDLDTVLGLMTDDVVFMVPGSEPFGKGMFAAAAATMKSANLEGTSEVRELQVNGDWAFARSFVQVAMTPPRGEPARRAGWVLSILRKGDDGRWRIARDANLLSRVS